LTKIISRNTLDLDFSFEEAMRVVIVFFCTVISFCLCAQPKSSLDEQLYAKRKELSVIGPELARVFLGGKPAPLTEEDKTYLDRDFLLSSEIWYDEPIGEDVDAWLYRRHTISCLLLTELIRRETLPEGIWFSEGALHVRGRNYPNLIPIDTVLGMVSYDLNRHKHELWERGFPSEEFPVIAALTSGENSLLEFFPENRARVNKDIREKISKGKAPVDSVREHQLLASVVHLTDHEWAVNLLSGLSPRARSVLVSYAKEYFSRGTTVSYSLDYFDSKQNERTNYLDGIKK
jgi:hypothetical protein